jgi:hypothetical protein
VLGISFINIARFSAKISDIYPDSASGPYPIFNEQNRDE